VADRKKEIEIKREKRLRYKRHSTEEVTKRKKETGERKRDKEREKRVRDTE